MNAEPLAIVGMACRLPGAGGLDEFWRLLVDGRSGIGEMPAERLDRGLYFDPLRDTTGKTYAIAAGTINHAAPPHELAPLSDRDREQCDPGHLAFCGVVGAALADAGVEPTAAGLPNTGVYVGHTRGSDLHGDSVFDAELEQMLAPMEQCDAFRRLPKAIAEGLTASTAERLRKRLRGRHPRCLGQNSVDPALFGQGYQSHLCAALVSRAFGFTGPSAVLNAACASSLAGLAMAANALRRGRIDRAVVGGASYCSADTLVLFSKAKTVTNGQSRPFDARAEGLVASEGHAVVVLKTLRRALADGDRVRAVVRGIGVASDGRGKSLWAPRREGQMLAIERAYRGDVDASPLQYVEAHATSTPVGDAVEMAALTDALKPRLPRDARLLLGSVKANVGHTLESAGLVGLVKCVLAMNHRLVPQQINFERPSPKIDWGECPFEVPTLNTPWPENRDGRPRRGAVNAFGIGGLNVHVVLDEFVGEPAGNPSAIAVRDPGTLDAKQADFNESTLAVVGRGCLLPGARDPEGFARMIAGGKSAIGPAPARCDQQAIDKILGGAAPRSGSLLAGALEDYTYDWRKHRVPPKEVASANPLQFMILEAVDAALAEAGLDQGRIDRQRTGVIVATQHASDFACDLQRGIRLPEVCQALRGLLEERGAPAAAIEDLTHAFRQRVFETIQALNDGTGSFTSSSLASRVTKMFDLMGGGVAIDSGYASSGAALAAAADQLLTGECDAVICAAGQRSLGTVTYARLLASGALGTPAAGERQGPNATPGVVPAEGAVVLILKRLGDAQRDGDHVYAQIDPIEAGFQDSGGPPAADHSADRLTNREQAVRVEASSTGIGSVDQAVLGPLVSRHNATLAEAVGRSPANQVGHLFGASGMAAALAATLRQTKGQPGDSSAAEQSPDAAATAVVDLDPAGPHHTIYLRPPRGEKPPKAMSSSKPTVERGGSYPPEPSNAPTAATAFLIRVQAASAEELTGRIESCTANSDGVFQDQHGANARPFAWSKEAPHRAVFVVDSAADLQKKCETALKCPVENRAALVNQGVFFGGPEPSRPRIAVLFPGQGSQYGGMLDRIAAHPTAADAIGEIDQVLRGLGFPSAEEINRDENASLGHDVWRTQMSMLIANTVFWRVVNDLGIEPECVAGHSFGEFGALLAARCWTFEDAARATDARCRAINGCATARGGMITTSAPATMVERLCCDIDGAVFPSNFNAPDQTACGGDLSSIERLRAQLEAEGRRVEQLAVPAPFHTPLMEGVKTPMREALNGVTIRPPRTPVFSSVTNRYVADPREIRDNLVQQMTMPVRFVELIEQLVDEGIEAFVEVGPRRVLTGLARKILRERGAIVLATDHRHHGPLREMLNLRAYAESRGADADDSWAVAAAARPASSGSRGRVNGRPTVVPSRNGPTKRAAGPSTPDRFTIGRVEVVKLVGGPREMGEQHGRYQRQRLPSMMRRFADLAHYPAAAAIPTIDLREHDPTTFFGSEAQEEIRGIAEGAGLDWRSVAAHNLRLYPDLGGGCSHFVAAESAPGGTSLLHAANHDKPLGLSLKGALPRMVQIRWPDEGYRHVLVGSVGEAGGITGVNAAGISVSSSMLLDLPRRAGTDRGRLHGMLVSSILRRADGIAAAESLLRSAPGVGAWALAVADHTRGEMALLEYDGAAVTVRQGAGLLFSTNHAQLLPGVDPAPEHSRRRHHRLEQLLGEQESLTAQRCRSILRDRYDGARGRETAFPTMNTIRRVDNQSSVVIEPATDSLWVTAGPDGGGDEDEFVRLDLNECFGGPVEVHAPLKKGGAAALRDRGARQNNTLEASSTKADSVCISADEFAKRAASIDAEAEAAQPWRRLVCRMVASEIGETGPAAADVSGIARGPVMLLGDNTVAAGLASRLDERSIVIHRPPKNQSGDAAFAWAETLLNSATIPTLVLATGCDEQAASGFDPLAWQDRLDAGLLTPYRIAQLWYRRLIETDAMAGATLLGATRLGGDFGFSGGPDYFEGGGTTGLLKAIAREASVYHKQKQPRVKIVDFDQASLADAATLLEREVLSGDDEMEVGYLGRRRHVARLLPEEQPVGSTRPSGCWIVTGGARGVTAEVAREIGRRFGLTLHLLGSSPRPEVKPEWRGLDQAGEQALRKQVLREAAGSGGPPIEAWRKVEKAIEIDRNLAAFAAAGVDAHYHACDVTEQQDLDRVLAAVRQRGQPITGVLHGAGFEAASRFEKKKPELAHRTIEVKVGSALALLDRLSPDPLEHFIGFGSTSGRFGGVGQADYSLANDLLAKLLDRARESRPGLRAACLHWPAWDEVGMAARPESRVALEAAGLKFMPVETGCRFAAAELEAGLPEGEVVASEWSYYQRFLPAQAAAAPSPAGVDSPGRASDDPSSFVAVAERNNAGEGVCRITLDPVRDPFLALHRLKQRPLLPFAMAVELFAQAQSAVSGERPKGFELAEMEIVAPLRFLQERSLPAKVRLERVGGNDFEARLSSDLINRRGVLLKPDELNARARLVRPGPIEAERRPLPEAPAWHDVWYPDENALLYHGEPLRGLRRVTRQEGGLLGEIEARPFAELAGQHRRGGWLTQPALLDACFFSCGVFIWHSDHRAYAIPQGVDRLWFAGRGPAPGDLCRVQVTPRSLSEREATLDFLLVDSRNEPVLSASGFRVVVVR